MAVIPAPSEPSHQAEFENAVDERLIVRALAYALGHTDPFVVRINSRFSSDFPELIQRYVADIEPTRRRLAELADRCSSRLAELDLIIAKSSCPDRLGLLAAQVTKTLNRNATWCSLFQLGLCAQRNPMILHAIDSIGPTDLEDAVDCLAYVIEQPPGDVEEAILRFDQFRDPEAEAIADYAQFPSSFICITRAA